MIVGEKMSAIANLIRTILGTTEKMGVDAIATNLESILTGLENAYTAVGSKNGTIPEQKTIGNLAEAIGTVSTGVEVQKKTGSFTTSKGGASIDCGFQPDLFYFTNNVSDSGYLEAACLAFAEASNTKITTTIWDRNDNVIVVYATRSTAGVSISLKTFDDDWNEKTYNGTFSYVAVKYT